MKTRIISLFAIFAVAVSMQLQAQNRVTVEAYSNDISYYLDLKAVATVFGESRNLQEFERRLNDYNTGISNLDLNNDGYIDYLRVIETHERNTHLVIIQAILERDIYQDVASIVIERDASRRAVVQVIGDPYLYGNSYAIRPVYYRTPVIVNWFWSVNYRPWYTPYYWGYYPTYYSYRNPLSINIYLTNINHRIDTRIRYNYNSYSYNDRVYKLHSSISRNDYNVRYPERNFNNRNSSNFSNKGDLKSYQNNNRQTSGNNSYNEGARRSNESVRQTTTTNNRNYQAGERINSNTGTNDVRRDNNSYQNSRTGTVERNSTNQRSTTTTTESPKPATRNTVNTPSNERPSSSATQRGQATQSNERSTVNARSSERASSATQRSQSTQTNDKSSSLSTSRSNSTTRSSSVQSSSSNSSSTRSNSATVSGSGSSNSGSNRQSSNQSSRSGSSTGGRR